MLRRLRHATELIIDIDGFRCRHFQLFITPLMALFFMRRWPLIFSSFSLLPALQQVASYARPPASDIFELMPPAPHDTAATPPFSPPMPRLSYAIVFQ
jgi:hypothetical protein